MNTTTDVVISTTKKIHLAGCPKARNNKPVDLATLDAATPASCCKPTPAEIAKLRECLSGAGSAETDEITSVDQGNHSADGTDAAGPETTDMETTDAETVGRETTDSETNDSETVGRRQPAPLRLTARPCRMTLSRCSRRSSTWAVISTWSSWPRRIRASGVIG
jgi:hypothetical protein